MHISCIPSCASCVPYHLSIMAFVPIEPFSHAYYTATNQLSTSSELCSVILWRARGTCSRFIIHIIITTFFWNHFPSVVRPDSTCCCFSRSLLTISGGYCLPFLFSSVWIIFHARRDRQSLLHCYCLAGEWLILPWLDFWLIRQPPSR